MKLLLRQPTMFRLSLISVSILLTSAIAIHHQGLAIAQTIADQSNHTTSHPALTLSQAPSPSAAQRRVQVFFPRYPAAENDFSQVSAVWRTASTPSIARFAIEQLIAGPTRAEQRQGLVPVIRLSGSSNCSGNFTLSIANQVARLQFCRQVISNGIGDDARARSAIEATLKQFSTVKRVTILDQAGNCLGDQSGLNRCLQ